MEKPTVAEILDDQLELRHSDADPSWRHGCYMYDVYYREEDNTYWAVYYQVSGDGEYNTLRDDPDLVEFNQVWPHIVETVEYRNEITKSD